MNLRQQTQRLALLVLGGTVLLLAGCGERATAPGKPGLTRIVLQTDWFAQPEHGGFYLALAKGYYREAGLDVVIDQGGPNATLIQRVVLGGAQFAIGRSDDLILQASRGLPVKMVGALMQRDPQAIMFHPESGIKGFKDLDGRTIMCVPGSNWITLTQRKYGIKFAIIPLDFGLSRFAADKTFVQQCFITSEPFHLRKNGVQPETLLLSDTGFSPYRVWFTSDAFLAKNPEAVRAFTAASIRGWREYVEGDRTAADQLIGTLNTQMTQEARDYSVEAIRRFRLVGGDPALGETVGQITAARIQEQIDQLTTIGVLEKPVRVADVFDEGYLPADVRATKPTP